jgi:hypothetical protein
MEESTLVQRSRFGWQIWIEAGFLAAMLILSASLVLCLHLGRIPIEEHTRRYLYAAVGGLLGGWAFTTKWFVRGTSRLGLPEKSDERWESCRVFWRLFTPFLAALVAFSIFAAGSSGCMGVQIARSENSYAFAFCVFTGYFSDAVVSKLANGIEYALGDHGHKKQT